MNTKKAVFVIAFGLLFVIGCHTPKYYRLERQLNAMMDSFVGRDVKALFAEWGPPSNQWDDVNDGKVYTWEITSTTIIPASSYSQTYYNTQIPMSSTNAVYNQGRVVHNTKIRRVWVRSSGIIYRWMWNGL